MSLAGWIAFGCVLWVFISLPVAFFFAQAISWNERPFDQEVD